MPRPVRTRLTASLLTAAATTTLGIALAPAAQADGPGPSTTVLEHLRGTNSNAPNVVPNVPPFGRKLS